jgi:hypothetical protein
MTSSKNKEFLLNKEGGVRLWSCVLLIFSIVAGTHCAPQFRINNGDEAKLGQFPSLVHIRGVVALCAGTIIDSNIVLTTGDCMCNQRKDELRLYVAVINPYKKLPDKYYLVKDIKIKPRLEKICGPNVTTLYYDLAILLMKESFELSKNVKIAEMSDNDGSNQEVTIVGYDDDFKVIDYFQAWEILKYGRVTTLSSCPVGQNKGEDVSGGICFYYSRDKKGQAPEDEDNGGPMFDQNNDVIGIYVDTYDSKADGKLHLYGSIVANWKFIEKTIREYGSSVQLKKASKRDGGRISSPKREGAGILSYKKGSSEDNSKKGASSGNNSKSCLVDHTAMSLFCLFLFVFWNVC